MSKKATRRAARDAFPKAPPAPVKRGAKYAPRPSGGKYTSKAAKQRARTTPGTVRGMKPPSWKRSLIIGFGLAIAYFLMTHYWQKDAVNIWGELLFSAIAFIFLVPISYFTDRWSYNRRLKRLQGTGK